MINKINKFNKLTQENESFIIIEHSDGSFTSMPEAVWDAQQEAAELGGTL